MEGVAEDAGPAPTSPTHEVHEVYENQRWMGTWQSPVAALDCQGWTDAAGSTVALPQLPAEDSPEWEVAVTPGTDDHGWQYATVWNHLPNARPGGRSSQRFGDSVRRRLWRRRDRAAVGLAPERPSVVVAAFRQRESLSQQKAIKAFLGLVMDLFSRRKVWTLLPWDLSAPFAVFKAHQETYRQMQLHARERQLLSEGASPPSMLRPDATLVQDLLCAAMHARAAYGFAMQQGLISSVGAYIKLQTVQPLTFNAVGGVSVEANNEAVAALAGISPEDILLAHWRNSPYRPCHYVAIDRANRCVVVSVRGSLQAGDLLSDLSASPLEVKLLGVEGWVHEGILAAATYIHCSTAEALSQAAERCPGWPVLLTGHSLGGGVAALLSILIQQSGGLQGLGPVRCITMGTAAVMSAPLAEACEDSVVSVIVGADPIPHLSVASVERLLLELSSASPVRRAAEELMGKVGSVLGKAAGVPGSAAKAWSSLKEANARAADAFKEQAGLSRVVTLARDEESAEAAAHAAAAATAATAPLPVVGVGLDVDVDMQEGSRGAAAEPAPPRQIPVIDLNTQEDVVARQLQAVAEQRQQQKKTLPEQQQQQQGEKEAGVVQAAAAEAAAGANGGTVLSELAMGGDGVGLEGFVLPEDAAVQAKTPTPPAGQSSSASGSQAGVPPGADTHSAAAGAGPQQQVGAQSQPEIVLMQGADVDSWLVSSAMAQAAASQSAEDAATVSGAAAQGEPGNPELLFPPGRLIWIFPAEVGAEEGEQEQEQEQGGSDQGSWQGVDAAWDAAWEGGQPPTAGDVTGREAVDMQDAAQQAPHAHQAQQAASSSAPEATSGGGRASQEATDSRDSGHEGAEQGGVGGSEAAAGQGGGTGGTGGTRPVVVQAERATFERLLLTPYMMDDHLPDRYLEAIQQL